MNEPLFVLLYEFSPPFQRTLRGYKIVIDRILCKLSKYFKVIIITGDYFRWTKPLRLSYWINTILAAIKILTIVKKYSKNNPKIILCHGTYGDLVSGIVKIFNPTVIVLGIYFHYEPRTVGRKKLLKVLAKLITNIEEKIKITFYKYFYDQIVTLSLSGKIMAYKAHRVPLNKVAVIGCTIDKFSIKKLKPEYEYIFIGHIAKAKDLVKIWPIILNKKPSAKLLLVGPSKGAERILEELTKLPNISYLGAISPEERGRVFPKAKVMLFPSRREGWCMAIGEALWAGLPVVAWNIPTLVEIYGSCKAVYLAKLNDYKEFSRYALEAIEKYSELSFYATQWASSLPSWSAISLSLVKTLSKVIKHKYSVL